MPPPNLAAGLVAGFLTLQLALFAGASRAAESDPLAELPRPGRLLLLRHANAPGIGDPAGFTLSDWRSQRNLDAAGRAQAARLGARLRSAGAARAMVYSSQWHRCLETARLLGLGEVTELPAINSFLGQPHERGRRVAMLRGFLAALPSDGPPVVLVTHRVVITALTGGYAAAGGGMLPRLNSSSAPRVLGEIGPDQKIGDIPRFPSSKSRRCAGNRGLSPVFTSCSRRCSAGLARRWRARARGRSRCARLPCGSRGSSA